MLTVEHLTFSYSRRSAPVLRDAALTLREGEIGILLGRNGSGKTTLFRNLLGICTPDSGSIRFDGQELTRALIDAYGADRVLFGTDYPMWDPQHELARLRGMHLAPETERKILYDNAAALFGLEGEN